MTGISSTHPQNKKDITCQQIYHHFLAERKKKYWGWNGKGKGERIYKETFTITHDKTKSNDPQVAKWWPVVKITYCWKLNDHKGKPNEMQMRGQDTETENQNDIKREKKNFWPKSQNGYSASRAQTSVWRELIIAGGEIHCWYRGMQI